MTAGAACHAALESFSFLHPQPSVLFQKDGCVRAAAVRHALSATSAEFASALSPSARISADDGSATVTTAGGDREGFLSRSAALLKKGSRRVTERGGSLRRASATGEVLSHVSVFCLVYFEAGFLSSAQLKPS